MQTSDIRNLILSSQLKEQPVKVDAWPGTNLIIRELSGKAGSDLISVCTDTKGNVDQESLVAGVVLATLRNADDPNKALVFAKADDGNSYDPAYRDALMSTGLGNIMAVANASITLSGLNQAANVDASKNDSSGTAPAGSASN
jgi:hypothetical protein